MRHRLRPVRPPHRARVRFTLVTLLLPILGFVVLTRLDVVRSPLAEREAALAVDLRSRAATPSDHRAQDGDGAWTAPTLALVARVPRFAGNRELQLRLPGIVAGCLALGAGVRLGTRLFAPRVGIAVGLLLLATSAGRRLLGTELGSEPLYLLALLVGLLAIRDMIEARIAALYAGVACGVALAVAGLDAVWLPVLALVWLRLHQGLSLRSFFAVVGTASAVAVVALAAGWALAPPGVEPLPVTSAEGVRGFAYLDSSFARLRPTGRELVALAPLLLLGLATMQSSWWRSESFRFLLLWLVLSGASWAATGSAASLYVALLFAVAAIALLGLEHARLRMSVPATAAAAALAFALWSASPGLSENQSLDRWAIREAGRFVGRVIHAERRLAASPSAAKRFAYYGNRPVQPFVDGEPALAGVDYVIVSRADYRFLRSGEGGDGAPRSTRPPSLTRIAEFGGWVVARVDDRSVRRREAG